MTNSAATRRRDSRGADSDRAPARLLRHGAVKLDGRRDGPNLLRLVLATMVLVTHGWYLSGAGIGPQVDGQNLGGRAVTGFFGTATTPANYVLANSGPRMVAYDVAGTPTGAACPGAWAGSRWTPHYELWCYLIIAAFMCLAWMHRHATRVAGALTLSVAIFANVDRLLP